MLTPRLVINGILGFEDVSTRQGGRRRVFGGSAAIAAVAACPVAPSAILAAAGTDAPLHELSAMTSGRIDTSMVAVVDDRSFEWSGSYRDNDAPPLVTRVAWGALGAPRADVPPGRADVLLLASDDPSYALRLVRTMDVGTLVYGANRLWLAARPAECRVLAGAARVVMYAADEEPMLDLRGPLDGKVLVRTRGSRGVDVFDHREQVHVPAPQVPANEVVDVTGAGDALCGVVAAGLALTGRPTVGGVAEIVSSGLGTVAAKLRSRGAVEFWRELSKTDRDADDQTGATASVG